MVSKTASGADRGEGDQGDHGDLVNTFCLSADGGQRHILWYWYRGRAFGFLLFRVARLRSAQRCLGSTFASPEEHRSPNRSERQIVFQSIIVLCSPTCTYAVDILAFCFC